MTAKPRPLCGVGVECYRGLCEVFSLTSAGAVVGVQQVTVATGAIEASDVVVTEVVAEQVLIGAVAALVHIWTKIDERQRPKRPPLHPIMPEASWFLTAPPDSLSGCSLKGH